MTSKIEIETEVVNCRACGTTMNVRFKKCPSCGTYNNALGKVLFLSQIVGVIIGVSALLGLLFKLYGYLQPLGNQLDIKYQDIPLQFSIHNHSEKDVEILSITAQSVFQLPSQASTPNTKPGSPVWQLRKFDLPKSELVKHGGVSKLKAIRAGETQTIVLVPELDLPGSNMFMKYVYNNLAKQTGTKFRYKAPDAIGPTLIDKNDKIFDFCETIHDESQVPVNIPKSNQVAIPFQCMIEFKFENKLNNKKIAVKCNEIGMSLATQRFYEAIEICDRINDIRAKVAE